MSFLTLNSFAQWCLLFSHDTVIIPLVIVGYIWGSRTVFFRAICIVLTTMPFSYVLKMFFQVPLLPSLGKVGFAFPSGHMQSCVSLYGFLCLNTANRIYRMILLIAVACVGWSLVYCGYHRFIDIAGAMGFGCLTLFVIHQVEIHFESFLPLFFIAANTLLALYILRSQTLPAHLVMSYCTLLSFTLSHVVYFSAKPQSFVLKIILTALCFGVIVIISVLSTHMIPAAFQEFRWLAIGASIPLISNYTPKSQGAYAYAA